MLAESFTDLRVSAPHWGFELFSGAVFAMLLAPAGKWAWRRALRRHDEENHPCAECRVPTPSCEEFVATMKQQMRPRGGGGGHVTIVASDDEAYGQ